MALARRFVAAGSAGTKRDLRAETADPVLHDRGRSERLHRGKALIGSLPAADWLPGDRGYDADRVRAALAHRGIVPCSPGRKTRYKPIEYDKRRYQKRNGIEIMFGRLKDWRRVATRYDRPSTVFLSAIALAATVLFCL